MLRGLIMSVILTFSLAAQAAATEIPKGYYEQLQMLVTELPHCKRTSNPEDCETRFRIVIEDQHRLIERVKAYVDAPVRKQDERDSIVKETLRIADYIDRIAELYYPKKVQAKADR